MHKLQEQWLQRKLIGLDTIIYESGKVINIDIDYIPNDQFIYSFKREYRLNYGEQSTLAALADSYDDDDIWSEVQINDTLSVNKETVVLCGEGEMGNEGFIVIADSNNKVKWALFSTTSNPFVNIIRRDDLIYIQSTANFYVVLNTDSDGIFISCQPLQTE
ncbi:hypothetical protein D3C74_01780 [compost metagenome]